ncbi:MAG TPA: imidazole glycerol phosphate synthase subunit HisH [Elusimicrobiota bacterium]|nr:imidazole glycerol phosphate synthase subunit HisH [Elusimicrobiota bacterium]
MIIIVDTGGANLASIVHALGRLGAAAEVTSDPARVRAAERAILPGVGAAPEAASRLAGALGEAVRERTAPTLGICLGMQLFFAESEEGPARGLGLLPGRVAKMTPAGLTVPHMGWNAVARSRGETPLLAGIPDGTHFYFVHSYAAPSGAWVEASCDYGGAVPAVVRSGAFHGVQFHPERSGEAGARVLRNFLDL